jgi:hypothetical protein
VVNSRPFTWGQDECGVLSANEKQTKFRLSYSPIRADIINIPSHCDYVYTRVSGFVKVSGFLVFQVIREAFIHYTARHSDGQYKVNNFNLLVILCDVFTLFGS